MSARTKKSRRGQQAQPEPPVRRRTFALVSAIVGAVVIVAIIVYAVLRANQAVPGSAVATDTSTFPPIAPAGSQAKPLVVRAPIGSISSSDLAGKPYLLEIFATWCPHCQRMTRVLRSIRASVPASRLAMISVTGSPYAADSTPSQLIPENQHDVDAFDAKYGVTWPSFFDPDMTVAKTWGLNGFPTIYVVDAKGRIVYSGSGEIPQATLLNAIRQAGA